MANYKKVRVWFGLDIYSRIVKIFAYFIVANVRMAIKSTRVRVLFGTNKMVPVFFAYGEAATAPVPDVIFEIKR